MADLAAEPAAAQSSHRGTRAIQRLVEFAPATGGLALWVRHQDMPASPPADALISTDGLTIFYNAGFNTLPVALQAGLVAHQVLHIALRHPRRFLDLQQLLGDVDLPLFNLCADAIVNSTLGHLSWLELPTAAVTLERLLASALGLNQSAEAALLAWDVEQLYRALDDRRAAAQGGARQDGPRAQRARALGDQSLADLLPDASKTGPPEAEAAQAREWRERIVRAHAGDGEFSMLRALIADLPRSRIPWQQVLRTLLARSLAPKPALSWSRPTRSYLANQGRAGPQRRMPWEPGTSASRPTPRLVVIVDVSGSIEEALMARFALEIEAITRRLEAGLLLVIGDNRVQKVARFEPGRSDLRKIVFSGGGGTDFTPLLEEADKHSPDIAVVLTDLQGPARLRPRWPVVWAVPQAFALAEPPFGRVLVLD